MNPTAKDFINAGAFLFALQRAPSRENAEEFFKEAVRVGDFDAAGRFADVYRWDDIGAMTTTTKHDKSEALFLDALAEANNDAAIRWLVVRFDLTPQRESSALMSAAGYGRKNVVEWMLTTWPITPSQADDLFDIASKGGNVELLEMLTTMGFAADDPYEAFTNAIASGSVPVADYLRRLFALGRNYLISEGGSVDDFNQAIESGSSAMVEWVLTHFSVPFSLVFDYWIQHRGYALEDDVIAGAERLFKEAPDEFHNKPAVIATLRELLHREIPSR